jgi:hypothetical protein
VKAFPCIVILERTIADRLVNDGHLEALVSTGGVCVVREICAVQRHAASMRL